MKKKKSAEFKKKQNKTRFDRIVREYYGKKMYVICKILTVKVVRFSHF